jgi:hypothetical protein
LCAVLSPAIAQQARGIAPEWEVRNQLTMLSTHVRRIGPLLDQLDPQEWVKEGAPAAYVDQLKRTRTEIGYLVDSADRLAAHPSRLTVALETFLRMQSVDAMLRSVVIGVRKYQNPAVADLLQSLISATNVDRDALRQYLVDLAADREQQFKIMDEEAQRCRAVLSRPPGASASRKEEHK